MTFFSTKVKELTCLVHFEENTIPGYVYRSYNTCWIFTSSGNVSNQYCFHRKSRQYSISTLIIFLLSLISRFVIHIQELVRNDSHVSTTLDNSLHSDVSGKIPEKNWMMKPDLMTTASSGASTNLMMKRRNSFVSEAGKSYKVFRLLFNT